MNILANMVSYFTEYSMKMKEMRLSHVCLRGWPPNLFTTQDNNKTSMRTAQDAVANLSFLLNKAYSVHPTAHVLLLQN